MTDDEKTALAEEASGVMNQVNAVIERLERNQRGETFVNVEELLEAMRGINQGVSDLASKFGISL
jgi:hypothetical protein